MKFWRKLGNEKNNILFNISFALFNIAVVVLFYRNIYLTTFLVLFSSVIALVKWRSLISLFVFIFGALFGSFSEVIVISYGAWTYSVTSFLNIHLWLFILWGGTVAFFYQTGKEVGRLGVKS